MTTEPRVRTFFRKSIERSRAWIEYQVRQAGPFTVQCGGGHRRRPENICPSQTMHRQELILHRAREGQRCPVGRIGQLQIEFTLMQGTQQLRSGRTVIGAGIGHERPDDRRIQCRSVELVAGFQDTEEPAQTTLPVDLDKSVAFTGLAGRVEIDLSHIRGRLGDRAIEDMTPPPAKLRQEECGHTLEIFCSERPNRAVLRVQH